MPFARLVEFSAKVRSGRLSLPSLSIFPVIQRAIPVGDKSVGLLQRHEMRCATDAGHARRNAPQPCEVLKRRYLSFTSRLLLLDGACALNHRADQFLEFSDGVPCKCGLRATACACKHPRIAGQLLQCG
jgi:hypothetical protein